jgi:hypothetical protein
VLLSNLGRLTSTLDRLVAMGRLARGLRSVYLTEYGYETRPLLHRRALSESTQARYLTWGEYLAWRVPAVKLFGQFLLRDQPPAATIQSDSPQRPFGQFYTGLEHADGTPKLAIRSFLAGLFAQRRGRHTVLLWGRLRLGSDPRRVFIERRFPGGRWHVLPTAFRPGAPGHASFISPGQDAFTRFVRFAPRARYRIRYQLQDGGSAYGHPVIPVARPG